MSIIQKYLTREIVQHFCIILTLVVAVYLAVDFFEKIDDFMEAGLPMASVLRFFLFKIPLIVAQILPVGLLLSILVTFGLMGKRNELIALKSTGVSMRSLFKPVAVIGIVGALVLFGLSEILVPDTMTRANRIWLQEVKKVSAVATREKNIWIRAPRSIIHITHYDTASRLIHGISVHRLNDRFQPVERIDARRGRYENGQWVLEDVLFQHLDPASDAITVTTAQRQAVSIDFVPADLKKVAKTAEEMSYRELRTLVEKARTEGYDATRYRVDVQYKIAFPLVCLIMCLIGTGIAVRGTLREGLPVMVAYGMAVAFLYWVVLSFCVSLGYGGILPPVAAAWSANLMFMCVGGLLLLHAE